MTASIRTRLTVTTIGILGVGLALSTVGNGAFAAQSPQQVLVVNTAADPVPVTAVGTTAVSGTVAISGPVTANLAANSSVVVANTAPLLTRDADAGQVIAAQGTFNVGISFSGAGANVFTVPAGKRFIVEFISAHYSGGEDGDHALPTIEWGGASSGGGINPQRHFLVPTAVGANDFVVSHPIKMVFQPLDFVQVRIQRSLVSTQISAEFNITGRLIDAN